MSHPDSFIYQSGGSIGDIGRVYKRGYFVQRGRGLSDIFQNIVRFLLPHVKGAGKALGRQALTSGINILEGLQQDEPIKNILMKERDRGLRDLASQASEKLKSMQGRGIKTKRLSFQNITSASLPKRRRRSTVRKTKKKSVRKKIVKKPSRRKRKTKQKTKSRRVRRKTTKKPASLLKSDILNQFMN